MRVQARKGDTVTYLYLMGVKPERPIQFSEHLFFEAATCTPNPIEMISAVMSKDSGSCSEIDLGVLIATLRQTTAQLKITASTAKELAIRAWNAQGDLTLLSALVGKEIYWHVQSDVEAIRFSESSMVNIIFHGPLFTPRSPYIIPKNECDYIEEHFTVASALMDKKPFYTAINSLWAYKINPNPCVQMTVLWTGIESLLGVGNHELTNRISTIAALFLGEGLDCKKRVKKLYNARSKAVHEGQVKDSSVVAKSATLLRSLILKCIEMQKLPVEDELLFGHVDE